MPRARRSKKPEDEQPSEGQGQPEEPESLSLHEPAVIQDDQLMKLVVVGSSAGGIQALSTLVESLPSNFPAPIVLAQHLDPQRPSNLARILERRSKLPVVTITS